MPAIKKRALDPTTRADLQRLRVYFRRAGNIANAVFMETVRDLDRAYTKVFETPGFFPAFPFSDIIDTGKLKDSQSFSLVGTGKVEFTWDAVSNQGTPYASFVHDGYTLRNGNWQPGRPWTVDIEKDFNFRLMYEVNLNKVLP